MFYYCVTRAHDNEQVQSNLTAEKVALVYQVRTSGFCRNSLRDDDAEAPAIVAVRRIVLHSTGIQP